jgi:hypothetical protein
VRVSPAAFSHDLPGSPVSQDCRRLRSWRFSQKISKLSSNRYNLFFNEHNGTLKNRPMLTSNPGTLCVSLIGPPRCPSRSRESKCGYFWPVLLLILCSVSCRVSCKVDRGVQKEGSRRVAKKVGSWARVPPSFNEILGSQKRKRHSSGV